MQSNLYVSEGYIQRRTQRTNKLLRLAGAAVLAALAAQLAVVGGYLYLDHLQGEADSRAATLAAEKTAIEEKLKPYSDVQAKYAQIMGWIPLLENRVPVSAIVSYVQSNIPPAYALRDLVLRSDELLPTASGFRKPKSYTLDMIGFVKEDAKKGEKEVLDDMRALFPELPVRTLPLPPGSESVVPPLWHVAVTIDPANEGITPVPTPTPVPAPAVVEAKNPPQGTPGPGGKPGVSPAVKPPGTPRPTVAAAPRVAPVKKHKVVLDLFHVTEIPADELPNDQQ